MSTAAETKYDPVTGLPETNPETQKKEGCKALWGTVMI